MLIIFLCLFKKNFALVSTAKVSSESKFLKFLFLPRCHHLSYGIGDVHFRRNFNYKTRFESEVESISVCACVLFCFDQGMD